MKLIAISNRNLALLEDQLITAATCTNIRVLVLSTLFIIILKIIIKWFFIAYDSKQLLDNIRLFLKGIGLRPPEPGLIMVIVDSYVLLMQFDVKQN